MVLLLYANVEIPGIPCTMAEWHMYYVGICGRINFWLNKEKALDIKAYAHLF